MAKENLNREFLAWLAGFWEGEGSFTVVQKTGGPTVTITQADRTPLDLIKNRFGVGRIANKPPVEGYRIVYQWRLSGRREVKDVMGRMLPFMKFRKAEVEEKLRMLEGRKNFQLKWIHDENEFLRKNFQVTSNKEMGKALGRSSKAVKIQLSRLRLLRIPGPLPWKRKYDWAVIKREYLSGKSLTQISQIYGIADSTALRALRKMGVQLRSISEGIKLANATQSSNV